MLITVKDNLKVAEKAMIDKDKQITKEKELLEQEKLNGHQL